MDLSDILNGGDIHQMINLGLLGVGLLFVITATFWGLTRGFKKTLFRSAWLVVTAIILFFLTPTLTSYAMTADISALGIEIEGVVATSIKGAVENMIAQTEFADIAISNPLLGELISKLPGLILNVFIFVILFWVLKIILYPVWFIISAIVIKKKDSAGNKLKKHRLLGMLTGAVTGVFIGTITLMPILNTAILAKKIEAQTAEISETNTGIITELAGADVMNYILTVADSDINKMYNYTGFGQLGSAMYSGLTTTKIGNHTINLEDDATNIVITVKLVMDLTQYDFSQPFTKESFEELLVKAEDLIDVIAKIGLVKAITDELIPYVVEGLTSGEEFFIELPKTENTHIDNFIVEAVESFENFTFTQFSNGLKAVISALRVLNENDALIPTLDSIQEGVDFTDRAQVNALLTPFTEEVVEEFFEELFSNSAIANVSPLAINAMLNYATELLETTEELEFDGVTIDKEELTQLFSGLVNTAVKIYNTLDFDSQFIVAQSTLVEVGKLIDVVKGYAGLTEENYTIIMNAVVAKINALLDDQNLSPDPIPTAIMQNVKNIISNIANITNFETEFTKLGTIFNEAISLYTAINDATSISYSTVGKILDTLKTTQLAGNEIVPLIKNAVDFVVDFLPEEFGGLTTVIANVKNNVTNSITWQTELGIIEGFANYIMNEMSDPDFMNNILSSQVLSELGAQLDSLKPSVLLGNQISNLMNEILTFVKDSMPQNEQDLFSPILNTIQNNITLHGNTISWATELGYLADFMDIFNQMGSSYDASILGAGLDSLSGSVLLDKTAINEIVAFMIEEVVGENSPIPSATLQKLIDALDDVESYEAEFTALLNLIESFTELANISDFESVSLSDFGAELDNYDVVNGSMPSHLISAIRTDLVIELFSFIADSGTQNNILDQINQDVQNNAQNIVSFETEFEKLEMLVELLTDLDTLTQEQIGQTLDNLTTGSVLFANTGTYILEFVFDEQIIPNVPNTLGMDTIIANIKTNTLTQTQNGTLTFEEALTQLDEIQTHLDVISQNNDENFNEVVVGNAFNDLRNISLFGSENVKVLSVNLIETLIDDLEQEQANYDPVLDPVQYGAYQYAIGALNDEIQNIESDPENVDYVEVFGNIKNAQNSI